MLGTKDDLDGTEPIAEGKFEGDHAYVVIGYDDKGTPDDENDDVISLFNPWGIDANAFVDGELKPEVKDKIFPKITIAQLKAYFETIRVPDQP